MAVHEQQIAKMGKGQIKTIDEGATHMVLDMLQRHQYTYPIKSTTRELLSNGVDSIAEKNTARKILSGQAKIEDFFVEKEGPEYKDSRFDPSYYNLDWFDDEDKVTLRYICGNNLEKDKVIISDTGVGLGNKRLEGYFSLAFSTKRLSKLPLGKFGIGAKSPLSIGVDYYTIESRYNGMLFRFNSYAHSFESIIPRFNLATGEENPFVIFSSGTEYEYKVYCQPTDLKNGLCIIIDAKKNHKQQYIDAVKSQMLYFGNIELIVQHENGFEEFIEYKADILYENEHIVISDNNYYTKPHLLLNKVNYGYIDFSELELEDRAGNVGIKVAPEELDVSPNRERVLWTDRTKEMVNKRFLQVVDIATDMIQEELKEPDLIKWLRLCANVAGRFSERSGVIGRLAKICDLASIKPKFSRDNRIEFLQTAMLRGLYLRYVVMSREQKANVYKNIVKRQELKGLGSGHIHFPIFLLTAEEKVSNRKDKWLLKQHPQGFITVVEPRTEEQMREAGVSEELIEYHKAFWAKTSETDVNPRDFWKYTTESIVPTWYKDIEVPKEFTGTDEEEEDNPKTETVEEQAHTRIVIQTAAERRKQDGKVIIYTPRASTSFRRETANGPMEYVFEWQKMEQKISQINDWDQEEIYYGNDADDEMLHFVAALTRDPNPENSLTNNVTRGHAKTYAEWLDKKWYRVKGNEEINSYNIFKHLAFNCQHFFDNQQIRIIKVSQANNKYFRDFAHIREFFIRIQNNTITMSSILVKWNTARIIKGKLAQCKFLNNFGQFNSQLTDSYKELVNYVYANYREVENISGDRYGLSYQAYWDLVNHLEKVRKFQEFVVANPTDTSTIADLATSLFGNKEITDGQAVDMAVLQKLDALLEFVTICGPLLNYIPRLTDPGINDSLPEELELAVKSYLEFKGILNYQLPSDESINQSPETQNSEADSDNSALLGEELPQAAVVSF